MMPVVFEHAIVRRPCPALVHGITTARLGPPDYARACAQHDAYVAALQDCGVRVEVLPAADDHPDSVFVEDVAICTPQCAIVTRPGAVSRRGETSLIVATLRRRFEHVEHIDTPGTLEGGDVMTVGTHCYVGLSSRTNAEGARQLFAILGRHGMTGSVLETGDVLHLKTGLAYLESHRLLAVAAFRDRPELAAFDVIDVPDEESYAANAIWVNGRVLLPDGFPETRRRIEAAGCDVIAVDTSEFRKLDGGVSCLSLRY